MAEMTIILPEERDERYADGALQAFVGQAVTDSGRVVGKITSARRVGNRIELTVEPEHGEFPRIWTTAVGGGLSS